MTTLCKECKGKLFMAIAIYLANGEFICQPCFGIDAWRRQQSGLPPLELGVIEK